MPTDMQLQADAIKIVLEWRIRPGARDHFEPWLKAFMADAGQAVGLQGSSVLASSERDSYVALLRFGSREELERWERSERVRARLREPAPWLAAPDHAQVRTGLETWFTLPGERAPAGAPPRWKMALVTWLALLPQVVALALVLPAMPLLLNVAISTAVPVAMLTWVVMPGLTRLLYGWLYAGQGH